MRHLALTASLVVLTAAPALAQTHSGSHDRSRNHGPGHARPDSATHAALHALLHGSWIGTVASHGGVISDMVLSVARDSLYGVTLTVNTDQPKRSGAATDLVVGPDGQLHWTQDLSGTRCRASAVLSGTTAPSPGTLSGKMSCDGVESTFTLKKMA